MATGVAKDEATLADKIGTGHVTEVIEKTATIPFYEYIILIAGPLATRRVRSMYSIFFLNCKF